MNDLNLTLDTVILRSSALQFSELDDEIVMMDAEKGSYYGLDDIGSRIWALAHEPVSISRLCDQLMVEYDVAPQKCQEDVIQFLADLQGRGIIQVVEGAGN